MKFIDCNKVSFSYLEAEDVDDKIDKRKNLAVDNVDFEAFRGDFIAVLGHNGSGKSTFAKLLNGIFKPTFGKVFVDSMDSSDSKYLWDIRSKVGMVFQNPDNQIVATIVEEDVAFGLENMGLESEKIVKRVEEALLAVDMVQYAKKEPHLLSGGQKQRIAIAGILAMKPDCIIFDEATAMLDPIGRKKVIDIIINLNKKENVTVILITHFMEEALLADKVFVMERGKVVLRGTPKDIFSNTAEVKRLGLDLPVGADIADKLRNAGFNLDKNIVYDDELVEYILKKGLKDIEYKKVLRYNKKYSQYKIIEVKNISFVYGENSVFEKKALKNISFDIFKGEILALIGHTGSGKSTLVQTLNGLIKPSDGKILYREKNIWKNGVDIKNIRKKVGIVFQYPEQQLFEETVLKDVLFAPLNMGFSQSEANDMAVRALKMVGIDESLFEKSPFELSGGEKRRIAIAGVIAARPEVLILDEPTAGLDPFGRNQILRDIKNMRDKYNMTVVMVSHSMEEVSLLADRIIVMSEGEVILQGGCDDIFSNGELLEKAGISLPCVNTLFRKIIDRGVSVPLNIYTVDDAVEFFKERLCSP